MARHFRKNRCSAGSRARHFRKIVGRGQPVTFSAVYGPVIQGKVMRLRPPTADDVPAMMKWFEDIEVTRFIIVQFPPSLEAEKEWLDKTGRDPNVIYWIVEHDARVVGGTGIV